MSVLSQARAGVTAKIKIDPITVVIPRPPMIDDGFGNMVEDPYGTPVNYRVTVRVSHDRKGPANLESSPTGFSTNLFRYILANYKADIREGDKITYQNKSYMIGPVDPLTFMGGVIGYQAPLKEAV